ncbi:MAG: hypothetical protein M1830_009715, partial [Pleopsidium flavum]
MVESMGESQGCGSSISAVPSIVPAMNFPFLKLPPQLHNMIYRLALVSPMRDRVDPLLCSSLPKVNMDLAIFLVNRLISLEASAISYRRNKFKFSFAVEDHWPCISTKRELFWLHPKLDQMKTCSLYSCLDNPARRTGSRFERISNNFKVAVRKLGEALASSSIPEDLTLILVCYDTWLEACNGEEWWKILGPFGALRIIKHVTFNDKCYSHLPEGYALYLGNLMMGNTPAPDELRIGTTHH